MFPAGSTFGPFGNAGPSSANSSPVFDIAREQAAPFWMQNQGSNSMTGLMWGVGGLVLGVIAARALSK